MCVCSEHSLEYLTCVSKASSQVLCIVDRILISCFADCEVTVNKHGQWALTGYINKVVEWQDQCGGLKTASTCAKRPHFLAKLPGSVVRDLHPKMIASPGDMAGI